MEKNHVSVMIHNSDNSKQILLKRLFSNNMWSCEPCFITIPFFTILCVKMYREKSTSQKIQPGHRIQDPCFLNYVTSSLLFNLHFPLHIFDPSQTHTSRHTLGASHTMGIFWVFTKLFFTEILRAMPSARWSLKMAAL